MARITQAQWKKYISRLRQINDTAADEFREYVIGQGGYANIDRQRLIDFAYGISTKYGEASAALSAEMYDAVAELSGVTVPAAVPAETATRAEVSKTVNGIIKNTHSDAVLAQGVSKLVKQAGADTILSNAYRDRPKGKGSKRRHSGALVAWIPSGDTCPFCLTLASKGWQNQTEWGAKNHAEHIHANCDCTYGVKFNDKLEYDGYDPEEYKKMYDNADGSTRDEKINSIRRMQYKDPATRDKINAQKRAAYAEQRVRMAQSAGDLIQPKSMAGNFDDYLGLSLSKETEKELRELHGLAKQNNYEYGLAKYDGGKTDVRTDNNHNNVVIGFPKDAKNVELLHCHTDESTLSTVDLGALVNPNINATTIITSNEDVWSAQIGGGIRPTQKEFEEAAKVCYSEAKRIVSEDPQFGDWTNEERYYMLVREQMREMGRYFEWDISGGKL